MRPPQELLPSEEWTADDVSITCPHGNRTEHDGSFPCDCDNPLKGLGI